MTLYIYATDNMTLVARINGETERACEKVASERFGDSDTYGWTYTPAFGTADGVQPGDDVEDIDA